MNKTAMAAVAVLALCVTGGQAAAAPKPASKDCKAYFKDYQAQAKKKAFAVSSDGTFCGYGYDYSTHKDARDRAVTECEKATGGNECMIYSEE